VIKEDVKSENSQNELLNKLSKNLLNVTGQKGAMKKSGSNYQPKSSLSQFKVRK